MHHPYPKGDNLVVDLHDPASEVAKSKMFREDG